MPTPPETANHHSWVSSIRDEFRLDRLMPSVTAGVMIGILVIFIELSFAALIFSGALSEYTSSGIGFMLLGAFVIGIVLSLTSSFPVSIGLPQDSPAAIMALVAAAIATSLPASAPPNTLFVTVVIAITITSVLTGIFFLILGFFELGSLVRFIPYPVVGGFLAGTGWLLLKGGIGVMTDLSLGFFSFLSFIQLDVMTKWLPGVLFGILLIVVLRRFHHFLIMPSMLVAAIGVFHLVLLFSHISISEASAQGWMLGPFPSGGLWQPIPLLSLSQVHWSSIFAQIGSILTILIISVISLLLNAGGVELAARCDVDLNRELRAAGFSNLLMGFCGSSPGYHALSLSVLGFKMGSMSRLTGLVAAMMCGMIFFFGASLLSFFPKFVLGGLLFFLGLSFLTEWLYDAYFTLSTADYCLVLLILAVVGTVGFLYGVLVGIILAVVLFVVKYSRIDVIKHILSGSSFRSHVDRAIPHQRILQDKGDQLLIYKLQGFLFFGTAHNLMTKVRQRATHPDLPVLRYVIFDFKLVTGLDSSAINSFDKMKQVAEAQDLLLVFVSLSPEIHRQFILGGYPEKEDAIVRIFSDLDHGMEWCEEQILFAEKPTQDHDRKEFLDSSFDDLMKSLGKQEMFESIVNDLMPYLERRDVKVGEYLVHQSDPPDELYFIESGSVTVQFENPEGKTTRLRTMHFGTVVGELGYYLEQNASASVVVSEPGVVYRLSIPSLQKMTETDPRLAVNFHKFMAQLLGEWLSNTNCVLKSLLD